MVFRCFHQHRDSNGYTGQFWKIAETFDRVVALLSNIYTSTILHAFQKGPESRSVYVRERPLFEKEQGDGEFDAITVSH